MAYSNDVKNEFIARRGLGESYHSISIKLSVSEKTLKQWGAKYADKIRDAESRGLEVAIELHNLARAGRLQAVGTELRRIDDELEKRDLSTIPASRLIMLKLAGLKLAGEIVGNNDGRKDDGLSPWEVMMTMLGVIPEEKDTESQRHEAELIRLRDLKYGGHLIE